MHLKNQLKLTISGLFPVTMTKYRYKRTHGTKIDFSTPTTFDEKLCYLKLFDYSTNEKVIQCADKYAVRSYLEENGCGDILNDLYGVYDQAEDIDFNALPNEFVLKCTHGCHMNIVCTNKDSLDIETTRMMLNKWLKEKQWREQIEPHYDHIKPRIICEKYLNPGLAGGGYSHMIINCIASMESLNWC